MLQNAYFLAKIGPDTAENDRDFAKNWQLPYGSSAVGQSRSAYFSVTTDVADVRRADARDVTELPLNQLVAQNFGKVSLVLGGGGGRPDYLQKAVSKPNFANKYAFSSVFQNLPDYLAEIFEIWQILQILQHNDMQKIC